MTGEDTMIVKTCEICDEELDGSCDDPCSVCGVPGLCEDCFDEHECDDYMDESDGPDAG